MKRCCHCRKILPDDQFDLNRSKPNGLSCQCRECRREERRSKKSKAARRQWVINNRQKVREINNRWIKSPKGIDYWRKHAKQQTAKLSDSVIRGHLKEKNIPITRENIEKQRTQIRAYRARRFFQAIGAIGAIAGG